MAICSAAQRGSIAYFPDDKAATHRRSRRAGAGIVVAVGPGDRLDMISASGFACPCPIETKAGMVATSISHGLDKSGS